MEGGRRRRANERGEKLGEEGEKGGIFQRGKKRTCREGRLMGGMN